MVAIFAYLQLKSSRGILRDAKVDHLNTKPISPCSFIYQQFYLFIMTVNYLCQCGDYFLCLPAATEGQKVQLEQEADLSLEVLYFPW